VIAFRNRLAAVKTFRDDGTTHVAECRRFMVGVIGVRCPRTSGSSAGSQDLRVVRPRRGRLGIAITFPAAKLLSISVYRRVDQSVRFVGTALRILSVDCFHLREVTD
jgi:hypothetical protein